MSAPPELPMMVSEGDIAVVRAVKVGDQEMRLKKPLRVPVERLHDCQLILDRIESRPA